MHGQRGAWLKLFAIAAVCFWTGGGCQSQKRASNDAARQSPPDSVRLVAADSSAATADSADAPEEWLSAAGHDSAMVRILDRLGIRASAAAALDTGCAIGDSTRDPNNRYHRDIPARQSVSCRIRNDRPNVEVVVLADTADDVLEAIHVFEARRAGVGTPGQIIALDTVTDDFPNPGVGSDRYLAAVDLDADGTRELLVLNWTGATGNLNWLVFRYDVAKTTFAYDSVLGGMWGVSAIPGRPCVHVYVHHGGFGRSQSLECLRGGEWLMMWSETLKHDEERGVYVRQTDERRGDALRMMSSDSVADADWEKGKRWKRRPL